MDVRLIRIRSLGNTRAAALRHGPMKVPGEGMQVRHVIRGYDEDQPGLAFEWFLPKNTTRARAEALFDAFCRGSDWAGAGEEDGAAYHH